MKVEIEKPYDAEDFGESMTIKISAFSPQEIFRLGVIVVELKDSMTVCGQTDDGKGMFLRLPLVKDNRHDTGRH